jgi:hypothetical protein
MRSCANCGHGEHGGVVCPELPKKKDGETVKGEKVEKCKSTFVVDLTHFGCRLSSNHTCDHYYEGVMKNGKYFTVSWERTKNDSRKA